MDRPEIHKAQVLTPPNHGRSPVEHPEPPIFVPSVRHQPVKLVRRGLRSRRRQLIAGTLLGILLLASFTYAFILENQREKAVRSLAP